MTDTTVATVAGETPPPRARPRTPFRYSGGARRLRTAVSDFGRYIHSGRLQQISTAHRRHTRLDTTPRSPTRARGAADAISFLSGRAAAGGFGFRTAVLGGLGFTAGDFRWVTRKKKKSYSMDLSNVDVGMWGGAPQERKAPRRGGSHPHTSRVTQGERKNLTRVPKCGGCGGAGHPTPQEKPPGAEGHAKRQSP